MNQIQTNHMYQKNHMDHIDPMVRHHHPPHPPHSTHHHHHPPHHRHRML